MFLLSRPLKVDGSRGDTLEESSATANPNLKLKSRMSSGRREKVWKITDIASTAEHANDRLFLFVMTDDITRRPPNAA